MKHGAGEGVARCKEVKRGVLFIAARCVVSPPPPIASACAQRRLADKIWPNEQKLVCGCRQVHSPHMSTALFYLLCPMSRDGAGRGHDQQPARQFLPHRR